MLLFGWVKIGGQDFQYTSSLGEERKGKATWELGTLLVTYSACSQSVAVALTQINIGRHCIAYMQHTPRKTSNSQGSGHITQVLIMLCD